MQEEIKWVSLGDDYKLVTGGGGDIYDNQVLVGGW